MHNFGRNLGYVMHSFRLCMFPLASALVAVVVLLGVPQGHETLRAIAAFAPHGQDDPNETSRVVSFFFGYADWGLANWYAARLLLAQEAPKERRTRVAGAGLEETRFMARWRTWFPRAFPLLAMAVIAWKMPEGSDGHPVAHIVAFVSTAIVALFIGVRRLLLKPSVRPEGRFNDMPAGDRWTLAVALLLSFVLLFSLAGANVAVARLLGAPALLFLALSSITLFGSIVLVYLPIAYDWPQIVWLPVAMALAWAQLEWNHNHRLSDREGFGVADPAPADRRPAVQDQFALWLAHQAGSNDPIFLVAAEGGASRSGWWVAHVLGSADYATHGEFSRRVFAVSGISGGSLGAATWVALLAHGRGAASAASAPTPVFPSADDCATLAGAHKDWPMPMQSECFIGRDVLSTTIGYLLFPDLFQRFMPFRKTSWDRSRGLELAWQQDWRELFGDDTFGKPLMDLYPPMAAAAASAAASDPASRVVRYDIPLLLLNSTRAGLGRPVLQAPVTIKTYDADDLFADWPQSRGLPLAAVVHNSARFPIVSPGGEIVRGDPYPPVQGKPNPRVWDSLVDGGYFENSGSFALLQMLKAIEQGYKGRPSDWSSIRDRIRIVFITNDVPAAKGEKENCVALQTCDAFPIRQEELLTPLIGLYETRSSRAAASMRALLDFLHQAPSDAFTLAMDGNQVIAQQPSMNWYLTPKSRRVMWNSFADSRQAAAAVARTASAAASAANAQGQAQPDPGPARNTAYEQLCRIVHETPGTRAGDPRPPKPLGDWCDALVEFTAPTQ